MKNKLLFPVFSIFLLFVFYSFDFNNSKVQKNETIARSFIEAWNTHDVDKLVQLFAEDGVYEEICTSRSFSTEEEIANYVEGTIAGAPDSKFEIVTLIVDGENATAEWVWKGTNSIGWESVGIPATGKYFELRGVSVLIIENNLIKRCSDYWDMNTFLIKIGVK